MNTLRTLSFALVATTSLAACDNDVVSPPSLTAARSTQPALAAGGNGNATGSDNGPGLNGPQISFCPICKIAYTQYDSSMNLFTVRTMWPNGTGQAAVYTGGFEPTWNATHTQLAVARVGGGISVMDENGMNRVDLTGRHDQEPNFAPSGKVIVFERVMGDGTSDLWTVTTSGVTTQVTNTLGVSETGPQFSPDGKKLVFARYDQKANSADLVVWDLITNVQTPISVIGTTGAAPTAPTWSPDGQRIAFTFNGTVIPNCLGIVNADGTGLFLPPKVYRCRNASYSPDGSQIALQMQSNTSTLFGDGRIGVLDMSTYKVFTSTKGPAHSTPAYSR